MDDLPLPPPPPSVDYEELPMQPGGGSWEGDYQQLVVPPSHGDYEQLPVMNGFAVEALSGEQHYDELDTVGALRSELQGAFYRRLSSAYIPHSETRIRYIKLVAI